MREPIVMCMSGGKDSLLSLYELQQQGEYDVVALLTTVTGAYDRVSMHGVRRPLLHEQARMLRIPLREVSISPGAPNTEYEEQMGAAFDKLRREGIGKVAFGDIFLQDLREYRARLLSKYALAGVFPIWHRDTRELAEQFIGLGFRALTVCIDPSVLDARFVGRWLDRGFLADLPDNVDPCGENGEYHSFVIDGPNFDCAVAVSVGETVLRDSFLYCDLLRDTETAAAYSDT